tara:strand:- start:20606 stop:20857 length:252 start_codon:yes stop_codon:yes gene_type:complete
MIDTDKYGMTNEKLLDTYSNLSVDGYKDLLAEVLRLREVAYRRICMIGERDKEIGRLREGIERIAKVQSIALHIEKALKELIE